MREAQAASPAGRRRPASFAIVCILTLLTAAPGAQADPPPCLPDADGDGHPIFGNPEYRMQYSPIAACTGDFDGDGDLDLAIANSAKGTSLPGDIAIMLNRGDGVFEDAPYGGSRRYAAGDRPRSIACDDFDNNGTLDLAVAAANSDAVFVLLGNGDGTFQPAMPFPVGTAPRSICCGDIDADGIADLATLNGLSNDVSVLLGNGDGTFTAQVPLSVTPVGDSIPNCAGATILGGIAVVLKDLDGDGNLDLATANKDSNTVSVLLGNGDGSFAPQIPYPVGNGPVALAVGDLDGDTDPDLVASNALAQDVSLLLNNGDGTFAPHVFIPVDGWEGPPHPQSLLAGPRGVALGDLDGDGDLDMGVGRGCPGWKVSVLLNNGDATFAEEVTVDVDLAPTFVAFVDLNGNGSLDMAVPDFHQGRSQVSIVFGDGAGGFWDDWTTQNGYVSDPSNADPTGLAAADLDGDGDLDLATANRDSDNVAILLNNGDGTFAPPVPYDTGFFSVSVAIGDLNGDPFPDLAVTNAGDNNVSVLLNNGDGTFGTSVPYAAGFGARVVAIGDLDGDGDQDLAVTNPNVPPGNTVSILLNNGDGSFAPQVTYPSGNVPWGITIADFDNDNDLDLAIVNAFHNAFPNNHAVSILLNQGNATFAPPVSYQLPDEPRPLATADLDDDGDFDLVVGINGNSSPSSLPSAAVLLNNGDGTFSDAGSYPVPGVWGTRSVALGDLDGDGIPDVALGTWNIGNVAVLLGNGDGTFAEAVVYGRGAGAPSVVLGDFDGDGDLDLASSNDNNWNVSILFNRACGALPGDCDGSGIVDMADIPCFVACLLDPAPAACLIADLNADGTPDGMDIALFVRALLP